MSGDWRWELMGSSGRPMTAPSVGAPSFPTRSEAESWVGEQWPALLEAGVDAVVLREGDALVYGPMSLRPAE